MIKVVGLGSVEPSVVSPVLGDGVEFIASPTERDLEQAAGAIVRAAYRFDAKQFAKMPNLKVIARTGVGTDLVDLAEASRLGVPVVITPGSNTNAVAEGAFAHALHLSKQLAPLTRLIREGSWASRDAYPVGDLEGSTIGIVGYGRIGRRVAHLAECFGMNVLAYDPFAEIPAENRVANLGELFGRSDVVTLHVPLTDETRHLVSRTSLSQFKTGAILVNCGRGSLVDLDAAHEALLSGQIAGIGLDVFDPEPPPPHPIFELENVVLTPHVMGLSLQATRQTFIDAAQGIRDVLDGKKPRAIAN
jgi:D-3-phosphoglycerate dehydrogenase